MFFTQRGKMRPMNRAQDRNFTTHIFNLPATQRVKEEVSQHLRAILF